VAQEGKPQGRVKNSRGRCWPKQRSSEGIEQMKASSQRVCVCLRDSAASLFSPLESEGGHGRGGQGEHRAEVLEAASCR